MSTGNDTQALATRSRQGLWKRLLRTLRGLDAGEAAEEVAEVLREREDRGEALEGPQKDMLLNAAKFDQLPVSDVMRPRTDIVAVEASATLSEVARLFAESQHSRLPIYRETLDDPLGFVHLKDIMAVMAPDEEGAIKAKLSDRLLARVRREILFVPPSMRLPLLLLKMRTTRIHIALVVDEYGGTDGLVTIEDLVEQIVGDIDDEYDVAEESLIQPRPGGIFEVDGRAVMSDLETAVGKTLALPEEDGEFDTIAGLVVAMVGRVPQRGEVLQHPAGFDVEVLDADPRRVKRLRLKPNSAPVAVETQD
jgi:CBS domain containing-hemolysin-like protein